MNGRPYCLSLVVLSMALACRSAPDSRSSPVGPASAPDRVRLQTANTAEVDAIADAYVAAVMERFPSRTYLVGLPGQRHDILEDNRLEALEGWHATENQLLDRLLAISGDSLLGTPQWVVHGALREQLEASVQKRICRQHLWKVNQMGSWHLLLPRVAGFQPVATPEERELALARWRMFSRYVETEIELLRQGLASGYSVPKLLVKRVIAQLDGYLRVPIDSDPFVAMGVRSSDAAFDKTVRTMVETSVRPAYTRYRDYLANEYLPAARDGLGLSDLPDGQECYRAMLRGYTTLDRAPEEVYRLGQAQVVQNRASVSDIGQRLYGIRDFVQILERAKRDPTNRFESREELLAFSRAAVARSAQAMPKWFARVPDAPIVVEPYPAYLDGTGVGSRYEAPTESRAGVYRITLHDHAQQRRDRAEIVAVHEAYPGHHLQIALAMERTGTHAVTKLLFNSGFIEGWGRYAEALAEEAGLYTVPSAAIIRRSWPARGMVVDPGIHVMGWDRDRARAFLIESGRFTAERADMLIDRIAAIPAQLTAYDSGALEIFALRRLAEQRLGDSFDIRTFHNALLENGTVPLWMLRDHVERWIVGHSATSGAAAPR